MQPFQQRVVQEKIELDTKLNDLHEFLGTSLYKELDPDEQHRLALQHMFMGMYSKTLLERIQNFK